MQIVNLKEESSRWVRGDIHGPLEDIFWARLKVQLPAKDRRVMYNRIGFSGEIFLFSSLMRNWQRRSPSEPW